MKEDKILKKLMIALGVSIGLNFLLLTTSIYIFSKSHTSSAHYNYKPHAGSYATNETNKQLIQRLSTKKREELISLLRNRKNVEEGYTIRDLALASLVRYHHFDLARGVGSNIKNLSKRKLTYEDNQEIYVFPGLTDEHFHHIQKFAGTELWPMTPYGQFKLLKEQKKGDPTLRDSFMMTPHFRAVYRLFSRLSTPLEKEKVLQILVEGSWGTIIEFVKEQRSSQDLSEDRRRDLLYSYVEQGSHTAAHVLVEFDATYVLRHFDNKRIVKLLSHLAEKNSTTEKFAQALLTSPRSDQVWNQASRLLYYYAGEKPPEKLLHQEALNRFIGTKKIETPESYTVQEGDSLWKIAKRFGISVDAIKEFNKLNSDMLRPGMELKVSR